MQHKQVLLKRDIRTRIGNYFWPKGSLVEVQKGEGPWWKLEVRGKSVLVLIDERDFREFVWVPVKKTRK
jgi:hypothetical protein